MISKIIIRLLTPIIVEVIRELLSKLAQGELVSIDETSVDVLYARHVDFFIPIGCCVLRSDWLGACIKAKALLPTDNYALPIANRIANKPENEPILTSKRKKVVILSPFLTIFNDGSFLLI